MLTMLEKVSVFTEFSRVSNSHLGNEDIFYNKIAYFALSVLVHIEKASSHLA